MVWYSIGKVHDSFLCHVITSTLICVHLVIYNIVVESLLTETVVNKAGHFSEFIQVKRYYVEHSVS